MDEKQFQKSLFLRMAIIISGDDKNNGLGWH
jgi:hypothetical protein